MKPFGIISDCHAHNWSAFATTLEGGINSRLQAMLGEIQRCANELRKAGGNRIVNAGDLFHVRGSIAPSVLNPVIDLHRQLVREGFEMIILAGNHDLESRHSGRLSSAITALETAGCVIINEPLMNDGLILIPWNENIASLKEQIESIHPDDRMDRDLILHAPVDGVILGIPDHGLQPEYLAGLDFKRVFVGHYHNHKDFGNGVYSIGALCHHSWTDLGSKAGFLIADDHGVKWFASHAPSFVEVFADTDPDEVALIVDGNFVRVKTESTKQSDIEALRSYLVDSGAKGVVVHSVKTATTGRDTPAGSTKSLSVVDSINEYIVDAAMPSDHGKLLTVCVGILNEVEEV